MYVVTRRYANADNLAEMMIHRDKEVRELISGVPGFVAYYAARDGDEITTITVCDDRTGVEESTSRAQAWVQRTLGEGAVAVPDVTEGETFLEF